MDSDRKSNVSSFYGGRKTSTDALNNDYRTPTSPSFDPSPATSRPRDDASSFFNPDRASRHLDSQNAERFGAAGYNRNSFFQPGREEPLKGGRDEEEPAAPDAWDVYADFNNAGPKYSTNFGKERDGYHPLDSARTEDPSSPLPVELVTVPALGPEWQKSEMRDMTKAGKKEKRLDRHRQRWREFNRGERGLCCGCLTRKVLAISIFCTCVVIGVVLGITIPRVPSVSFNSQHPLVTASGSSWESEVSTRFSHSPANFSFPAFVDLQLDTGSNYLPLTFNNLKAQVFDIGTGRQVASGDLGKKTVPAKSFPIIQLPLNFTYIATNDTDQTWKNWYAACRNRQQYADGSRPGVSFRLVLDMHIAGLPSSSGASTQISNADCPVELANNAG